MGRHLPNPELIAGWAKGVFEIVLINVYLASVSLPKLSALFFYLRVFVYRKGRIFAYITIGLVILNWVVFSITSIFQCRPIAYWWDRTIQGGVCFNVRIYYSAICVPNIATDVIVLLLPISSLIKLKLPLLKKIALCFIFLTASVWFLPMSVLFRRKLIFLEACSHPYIDSHSSLPPIS
jgi:rhodopsin domain-containing protein